jgi:hypothetical protein
MLSTPVSFRSRRREIGSAQSPAGADPSATPQDDTSSLHASRNPLKLSSRPEPTGILFPQQIYGAEWRDPEGLYLTMLQQGVLPGNCPVTVALRDMPGLARTNGSRSPIQSFLLVSGCSHCQSGENALKRHGEGNSVGIPPLRARDFFRGRNSRGAAVGMTEGKGIGEIQRVDSLICVFLR